MAFSAVTPRGSANNKVSGTTLAGSPSGNITVGKIAFVLAVSDNVQQSDGPSTLHTSITDTDGHTWTKVFERTRGPVGGVALGATGSLWFTKVTTQIDTSDSITLTLASSVTAKAVGFWEVTVGAGNSMQVGTSGVSSAFAEAFGAGTPSVATSGMTSKEYLHIGLWAVEGVGSWTEDTDYTNVFAAESFGTGTTGTDVSGLVGSRIATLTGDTFQAGIGANRDMVIALVAFEEVTTAVTATVAVTEQDDTSAISGVVANPVTGTIGATEGADTSSITAVEGIPGTVAATEGNDTSNFTGLVANPITGTIGVTEQDDTPTISGTSTSPAVTANISVTEQDDTANFTGTVTPPAVTGTISVTEGDDTANFAGSSTTPGTMVTTEQDDVANFTGIVANPVSGTITVTEADDVAAMVGLLSAPGTISGVEGDDTANFVGMVANPITGMISVVEQDDVGLFVGTTTGGVVIVLTSVSTVSSWGVSSSVRGLLVESEVQ